MPQWLHIWQSHHDVHNSLPILGSRSMVYELMAGDAPLAGMVS